ncbi:MAG: 6-bladed beta-propeller [Candidatus Aminicenantes bacterium]|nr:6-bladed beta-propeller [Candidatus Aminicenantes bacterium]
MKKVIYILVFFIITAAVPAQKIIENPEKALNQKAGRILKLKEEMRIDGEGENYYFYGVNKLQIDTEGNLYLRDSWHSQQHAHLLKFSPEGKFIIDLYKLGEGPGEIQSNYDFALGGSKVFLFDYMKRKVVVLDPDGGFIHEFKLEPASINDFIGVYKEWLVFLREDWPVERKTSKLYEVNDTIVFISMDGSEKKEGLTFSYQRFLISFAQGGGMMSWDPVILALKDNNLFVCRSMEYIIEVFNLNSGKITQKITRDYPRVKHEQKKWEKDFIAKYDPPKRKYENDIKELFTNQDQLWVKTSFSDKEKGSLFDVFNAKGEFIDSFFINIKGRVVKIEGEYLYASESDAEDLPLLIKYRIMEPILN